MSIAYVYKFFQTATRPIFPFFNFAFREVCTSIIRPVRDDDDAESLMTLCFTTCLILSEWGEEEEI